MGARVAIYSLTRDRLAFTKVCFSSLQDKAGYPFDHYVIDNGSEDGTVEWLCGEYSEDVQRRADAGDGRTLTILLQPFNLGISRGSNIALDCIFRKPYDLIAKMDNDCFVVTSDILRHLVGCFEDNKIWAAQMALSPHVLGIVNQPTRIREHGRNGIAIGETGMIGGLFHILPAKVYEGFRYPEDLPLAWGQDDALCAWLNMCGVIIGYVEPVIVEHYLTTAGQAEMFPEYFTRKRCEEQDVTP